MRSVSAIKYSVLDDVGLADQYSAASTRELGVRGYVSAERFTRTGIESVTTYSVASGTDGVREHLEKHQLGFRMDCRLRP